MVAVEKKPTLPAGQRRHGHDKNPAGEVSNPRQSLGVSRTYPLRHASWFIAAIVVLAPALVLAAALAAVAAIVVVLAPALVLAPVTLPRVLEAAAATALVVVAAAVPLAAQALWHGLAIRPR